MIGTPATEQRDTKQRDPKQRDDEDAAAVIAVLTLLAGAHPEPAPRPRDVWGSQSRRLGVRELGDHSWWASGQPR